MSRIKHMLAVAALAWASCLAGEAAADPIVLYATGFDIAEGYTLGTGASFLKGSTLKGQNGWVGTTSANSWISNDTSGSTSGTGDGYGRELRFTGTGYARMTQVGADHHALDDSGMTPRAKIDSITIQFDMARIADDVGTGGARMLEFKIGGLVFMRGDLRDSLSTRALSELRTPDGTAWSGGWTGSEIKSGGDWVWQDRLRARFTITVTENQITGGFTVLDRDLINRFPGKPEWLSDDSFTYDLNESVDLSKLAASNISFYSSINGKYTQYMIDELLVTANTTVPEPASAALVGLGVLTVVSRRR